jgi:hypothetical protein
MRKIVLKDGVWQWSIGKENIVIKAPNGRKILTNKSEVSGRTWTDLELDAWKENTFSFTPKIIKEYIEKHCITK